MAPNQNRGLRIPSPYLAEVHPQIHSSLPLDKRFIAYVALSLFFVWSVWQFFSLWLAVNIENTKKYRVVWVQRLMTTILLLFGLAYGLDGLLDPNKRFGDEPFALIEGVSMWPSEAIRYLAIIVALNGIVDALTWPMAIRERLVNKLGFTPKDAEAEFKSAFKILIIFLKCFLIFIFAFILIIGLGYLNIPYRGDRILNINKLLIESEAD